MHTLLWAYMYSYCQLKLCTLIVVIINLERPVDALEASRTFTYYYVNIPMIRVTVERSKSILLF